MELIYATIQEFSDSRNIPHEVSYLCRRLSAIARHERIQRLQLHKYLLSVQCHTQKYELAILRKNICKHERFKRKITIIHNRFKHDLSKRIILILQILVFFTKSMKLDKLRSEIELAQSNGMSFFIL